MAWLEYNIHLIGQPNYNNIIAVLVDLIQPFVDSCRDSFVHWHYLLEPDKCGASSCEIRLRFEGSQENLKEIKQDLIAEIENYSDRTHLVESDNELTGSHEGCHGDRNSSYLGPESENFGRDWNSIVDILQIGSESAIHILGLGRGLVENRSLQVYQRSINHPYFLHLPANQLVIEP